jgi:hypothetical protein
MSVSYEWIVEVIDDHGDIDDVRHHDSAIDMLADVASEHASGRTVNYGIVRDAFSGMGIGCRSWAYVKDGKLPSMTVDAGEIEIASVPKRLIKELEVAKQS